MHPPDATVVDATTISNTAATIEPDAGGYERTDVSIEWVLLFFGLMGVSLIVLQLGVWEFWQLFRADVLSHQIRPSPRAVSNISPPEPRLQEQPLIGYARYINAENARLNNYGWIDRRHGIVHIPISDAMEILAERGLPAMAEPQSFPKRNVVTPEKVGPSGK